MSKLKFDFPSFQTPPDLYRWAAPNGHVVTGYDRNEWLRAIQKFCKDNDIALEDGWEAEAEDKLCRVLPPGWCKYEDGGKPQTYLNVRIGLKDLQRGAEILVEIISHPDPLVSQEEADRRARICANCPANTAVSGCFSCFSISELIANVKGARKTVADSVLKNCAPCKCPLRSMVWVKDEVLAKSITEEHHAQYQMLDWCWKKDIAPQG